MRDEHFNQREISLLVKQTNFLLWLVVNVMLHCDFFYSQAINIMTM